MTRKTALVTGASRGIGKACALELAEAGFDVAITARTLNEGEAKDGVQLPGSLQSTLAQIEAKGVRGMAVPADLLEPETLTAAVTRILDHWGRIDVVVHNGIYSPPNGMTTFLETPLETIRKQLEANAIAPLVIDKLVLPGMIANGGGTLVHITAAAGYGSPLKPAGLGGWELGYGMSKAAFHRIAGVLKTELGDKGIRCFNVQPGFIATEKIILQMAAHGIDGTFGAPPQAPAKVVRWLCTDPEAEAFDGKNIEALEFCHERNLLPGWSGEVFDPTGVFEPDLSGLHYQRHMDKAVKVKAPG